LRLFRVTYKGFSTQRNKRKIGTTEENIKAIYANPKAIIIEESYRKCYG
jgi:hypothetical protein